MRSHAEFGVDEDTEVTHRCRRDDGISSYPERRPWALILPTSSDTPQQLRLIGIQLKTVVLDPAIDVVNTR